MYVLCALKKRLREVFLLRTQNICFYRLLLKKIKNIPYFLNPVFPNLIWISEYSELSKLKFSKFYCINSG